MPNNTSIDQLQSKTIDWLRFPLTIAVVFIHSFGDPKIIDMQSINYAQLSGMDIYNIIRVAISHVITHIAVPTFFLFSGFLFFLNMKKWDFSFYLDKMKNRFRTLVIPYFLWNLLAILVVGIPPLLLFLVKNVPYTFWDVLFDKGLLSCFWNCQTWAEDRTNLLGGSTPMSSPYNVPLWFLRDLIVVVISTPIIYYVIKSTKILGLILLGIAFYTKIWIPIQGFSITALFFFSFGAFFSINRKNMIDQLQKIQIPCLIIAVITMILCVYYDGIKMKDYYYPIFTFTGSITAINMTSYLISIGWIKKVNVTLSKASFFIFAIHTILIVDMSSRVFDLIVKPVAPISLTIKYLLLPFIIVSICLVIYRILEKFIPKTLGLFTGNRM